MNFDRLFAFNRRSPFPMLVSALALALLLPSCAFRHTLPPGAIEIPRNRIVYIDGDTIRFDRITIRVLGIDTPEIAHKGRGFKEDQPYGRDAAARAEELMRSAEHVSYLPCKNDQYGRLLAHLFIDDTLLGEVLLREGLAYETISHYGDNGFPGLAGRLLKAAEEGPEPKFRPPYIWRREHR